MGELSAFIRSTQDWAEAEGQRRAERSGGQKLRVGGVRCDGGDGGETADGGGASVDNERRWMGGCVGG